MRLCVAQQQPGWPASPSSLLNSLIGSHPVKWRPQSPQQAQQPPHPFATQQVHRLPVNPGRTKLHLGFRLCMPEKGLSFLSGVRTCKKTCLQYRCVMLSQHPFRMLCAPCCDGCMSPPVPNRQPRFLTSADHGPQGIPLVSPAVKAQAEAAAAAHAQTLAEKLAMAARQVTTGGFAWKPSLMPHGGQAELRGLSMCTTRLIIASMYELVLLASKHLRSDELDAGLTRDSSHNGVVSRPRVQTGVSADVAQMVTLTQAMSNTAIALL